MKKHVFFSFFLKKKEKNHLPCNAYYIIYRGATYLGIGEIKVFSKIKKIIKLGMNKFITKGINGYFMSQ